MMVLGQNGDNWENFLLKNKMPLLKKDDESRSEPGCPTGKFISESHYIDENFLFYTAFNKAQSKKIISKVANIF